MKGEYGWTTRQQRAGTWLLGHAWHMIIEQFMAFES